jgi:hypothetical protein
MPIITSTPSAVRRVVLTVLGLCLSAPLTWVAAQDVPQRVGVITPTRLVKLFYGIERQLLDAQAGGHAEAVKALLAEEFMQRSSLAPLAPVAREAWIAQARVMSPTSVSLDQMAVHEQGPLAIVSFVMLNNAGGSNRFVVDVWRVKEDEDHYELLNRYISDIPRPPAPVVPNKPKAAPAASSNASAPARAPTGKE